MYSNDDPRIKKLESFLSPKAMLCHYTSFESAMLIISTMTLRFSNPSSVNDINESSRNIISNGDKNMEEIVQYLRLFKQISLTEDGKRKCFDIPAMWGHYAKKGDGVCILFDRDLFLSELSETHFHGPIHYQNYSSQDIPLDIKAGEDYKEVINRSIRPIFFEKTLDWSYEQEYRIVTCCEKDRYYCEKDHYYDIPTGSILAVILCNSDDSTDRHSTKGTALLKLMDAPVVYYEKRFFEDDYNLKYFDQNGLSHTIPVDRFIDKEIDYDYLK